MKTKFSILRTDTCAPFCHPTRAQVLQSALGLLLTSIVGPSTSTEAAPVQLEKPDRHNETLSFIGELDCSVARDVCAALATLKTPAVIDLSRVRYIDASIIGAFLGLARRLAPERPILIGLQPQVRRILEVTKVDQLFDGPDRLNQVSEPLGSARSSLKRNTLLLRSRYVALGPKRLVDRASP